jgi:hypothetical protein
MRAAQTGFQVESGFQCGIQCRIQCRIESRDEPAAQRTQIDLSVLMNCGIGMHFVCVAQQRLPRQQFHLEVFVDGHQLGVESFAATFIVSTLCSFLFKLNALFWQSYITKVIVYD